jgi:HAMP domain-containing protein
VGIGDTDVDREAAIEPSREDGGHGRPGSRRGRKGNQERPARGPRNPRDRELRRLLKGLRDLEAGDFGIRLESNGDALMAEIFETFNEIAERNQRLCQEFRRVAKVVGREGRMDERATIGHVSRAWADTINAVNELIGDLVQPTTEVARVIQAVAEGDLSQQVELELEGKQVQGEFLRIATTVNRMVDQLSSFSVEVTRVAREVGTEGILGGQANVPGVAGTWRDLTESVNAMANNLTTQVRNIADVTTAVARGDLSRKITVDAKGEILELKSTVNTMVDQLGAFA